jgi:hypothetical protein
MSRSDKLFEKIQLGETIHSSFSDRLKQNLLLYDKTIPEWWQHFGVRIETDNLNPEQCRMYGVKIANLYQEASFYYSLAIAEMHTLESSSNSNHAERIAELVANWEMEHPGIKLPAATTLENLARNDENDIYSAISIAKLNKDFWKTVLNSLDTCRKILENSTVNNGIEAKLNSINQYKGDDNE